MFEGWIADIPSLPFGLALLLLIINVIVPSLGTFLLAFIGDKFRISQLIVGILQILFVIIIFGWVWSIWWGILILKKSYRH
jgi:hypothetical protein